MPARHVKGPGPSPPLRPSATARPEAPQKYLQLAAVRVLRAIIGTKALTPRGVQCPRWISVGSRDAPFICIYIYSIYIYKCSSNHGEPYLIRISDDLDFGA